MTQRSSVRPETPQKAADEVLRPVIFDDSGKKLDRQMESTAK
jgi:hypothetical protein